MNEEAHGAIQKPVVLVIDDTPDNLALMSALLGDQYEVKVANSGRRGLRVATSGTPPDLILLDVMMPEMDGYAVCREIKAHARTRDVPVIFMTALDAPEDARRGFESGAVDYVAKPIDPPSVLACIRRHLAPRA